MHKEKTITRIIVYLINCQVKTTMRNGETQSLKRFDKNTVSQNIDSLSELLLPSYNNLRIYSQNKA